MFFKKTDRIKNYLILKGLALIFLHCFIWSSCSVKNLTLNTEDSSPEEKIALIRDSVEKGDWIAVTIDNVKYDKLKVIEVGTHSMAVTPPENFDDSASCYLIEFSDIEHISIENIKVSDKAGFLVTTLIILFYILV